MSARLARVVVATLLVPTLVLASHPGASAQTTQPPCEILRAAAQEGAPELAITLLRGSDSGCSTTLSSNPYFQLSLYENMAGPRLRIESELARGRDFPVRRAVSLGDLGLVMEGPYAGLRGLGLEPGQDGYQLQFILCNYEFIGRGGSSYRGEIQRIAASVEGLIRQSVVGGTPGSEPLGGQTQVSPPADQAEEPPRILTMEEQTQRCTELAGAARDECRAAVSLTWLDPSPCGEEVGGGCRQRAAEALMTRCQTLEDGATRLLCFGEVATNWMSPESCNLAEELGRERCLVIVATESRNPRAIIDHVDDPRTRDGLLGLYAASTRDPSAISLISSDEGHDFAVLMTYTFIAIDTRQLDTTHCARLRGTTETTGIDQEMCRRLAAAAVRISEAAEIAEAEGRGDEFRRQLIAALEDPTEEALGQWLEGTPDPGEVTAVP